MTQQIVDFLQIAEKLGCEYRLTRMSDGEKQSVAAHSWNMAIMAMVLKPYLKNPVDMERVYQLCLLHDLPEAIAHDVPLHEQNCVVRAQKHIDECAAIHKIVNILNDDDMQNLFTEYEERQTNEAKLVKALDILDTAVQHMCTKDLSYIGEYADGFYWKMFFSNDFAKTFDFEPVLRETFNKMQQCVEKRLKNELGINAKDFAE